jgi:hypothetical protein
VVTPFIPSEGDNFDSKYCNRQDQIDKESYNYYLNKINNETIFQQFYFNFYDEKSKEAFFELDNVNYKFYNLHDDTHKDSSGNKIESTGKAKNTINSSIITPRIDMHTINLTQTYLKQNSFSHRKLFGNSHHQI